jgi:trk system potassium uptake protein TrkA
MFIIIVGCSEIGYHLSKLLMVTGNEVVVMEKNLARYQLMWEEMGSVVVQGDGADQSDLKRAGAARADTLVAVTDRDETNLVACQLAKHIFSTARTIATIKDPKNQPIFRLLGVDVVVNSSDLILNRLERSIVDQNLNHLVTLGASDSILISITIPEDAAVVGKSLSEVALPPRSFVSLVIRQDRVMPPSGDHTLAAHDQLYAVTATDEEQRLYDILTGV